MHIITAIHTYMEMYAPPNQPQGSSFQNLLKKKTSTTTNTNTSTKLGKDDMRILGDLGEFDQTEAFTSTEEKDEVLEFDDGDTDMMKKHFFNLDTEEDEEYV